MLVVVEVPRDVVCQYQVSPPGGVPFLVRVTPVGKHCGLLLVGLPGLAGQGLTVNVAALVVVPIPTIVMETVPVVPDPITATICVPVFDVIDVTGVPPIVIFAAVAPVKSVPFIVIEDPTQPLAAPKLVIFK